MLLRSLLDRSILAALFTVLAVIGCGDDSGDDDSVDAAIFDARLGADSNEMLPDGGQVTLCGVDENPIECQSEGEICTITNNAIVACAPADFDSCSGSARNCANCGQVCGGLICDDGPADNIVLCSDE
jgi:hypothetical protein